MKSLKRYPGGAQRLFPGLLFIAFVGAFVGIGTGCATLIKLAQELGTDRPYSQNQPPPGPRKLYDPSEWPNETAESKKGSSEPEVKPKIEVRSRAEILELMVKNHSLTQEESLDLDRQLTLIAKYTATPQPLWMSTNFKNPAEEKLLKELVQVALNVKKVRGYFPRETQLIAVLQFLRGENRLLQAGTGQGKSLIVAMTAIVQSKLRMTRQGMPSAMDTKPMAVHIMTPTSNLAEAGFKENKELFDTSGVKARYFETTGGSSDIVYGTPYDFEGTSLNESDDPKQQKILLDPSVKRTVILDESDSHLIDGATGRVRVVDQDPDAANVKKVLLEIFNQTQAFYQTHAHSKAPINSVTRLLGIAQVFKKVGDVVNTKFPAFKTRYKYEGMTWVSNAIEVLDPSESNSWKNGVKFVLKDSMSQEISNFLNRVEASGAKFTPSMGAKFTEFGNSFKRFADLILSNQLSSAKESELGQKMAVELTVALDQIYRDTVPTDFRSQYEKMRDLTQRLYDASRTRRAGEVTALLFTGDVKYLSVETGQVIDKMVFGGGIQEFLEQKYLGRMKHDPTVSIRSYSLFKYVRKADLVLGLSGTVGVNDSGLMKFQRHVWEVKKSTILPEFAVPQLKNVAHKIHAADVHSWMKEILHVLQNRGKTQPVLIIAENPNRVWELSKYLVENGIKPLIYAEGTDEHLMQTKLGPNQVVVATNLGGRGSDYKYDTRKAPDGLHVIIAFDSDEERILQQARGRAGRAGAPGTWQQISFGSPLNQKPDIKFVEKGLETTLSEDMGMEIYIAFMEMAQSDTDKTAVREYQKLLMGWLANPSEREKLMTKVLKPGVSTPVLISDLVAEWIKYLAEDSKSSPVRARYLGLMKSSPGVAVSRLASDLGQSRKELARLRSH